MERLLETLRENFDLGPVALRSLSALLVAALIAVVYRLASRAIVGLHQRGRVSLGLAVSLRKLCRVVALLLAALLVLQQFGILVHAWAMLSALLALLAVAFVAVWSVLSNTLCALILLITRPFEVGDTVELVGDKLRGKVIDFSLLFTTLRDDEGELIQVPNNQFFQKAIRRRRGDATVSLEEQLHRPQATDALGP